MKTLIVSVLLALTTAAHASKQYDVIDEAKSVVENLERNAPYMSDVQADQVSYLLKSIDQVIGQTSDRGDKDQGDRGDHDYRKERFE